MNSSTEQIITSTVEAGVARVTLNRPDKRNALNDELVEALKKALREADADESVRVIILSGAGPDFCSGADLSALRKISVSSITGNLEDAQSLMELFSLIRKVRVPVVAAVRGRALAGGCGLATACDLILAARSSSFGYPEVGIGFVPAIVAGILRRSVSEKQAFALLTRGTIIDADQAHQIGLLNEVFDETEFDTSVEAYVNRYLQVSRSAVMLTKRLLYQIDGLTLHSAMQTGVDVNTIARMTDDCRAGIDRFLKKS